MCVCVCVLVRARCCCLVVALSFPFCLVFDSFKFLANLSSWEEQSRKWTELAAELNADAVLEWINHFLHGDVVVLTKENFQLSVSDGRVWLVE